MLNFKVKSLSFGNFRLYIGQTNIRAPLIVWWFPNLLMMFKIEHCPINKLKQFGQCHWDNKNTSSRPCYKVPIFFSKIYQKKLSKPKVLTGKRLWISKKKHTTHTITQRSSEACSSSDNLCFLVCVLLISLLNKTSCYQSL